GQFATQVANSPCGTEGIQKGSPRVPGSEFASSPACGKMIGCRRSWRYDPVARMGCSTVRPNPAMTGLDPTGGNDAPGKLGNACRRPRRLRVRVAAPASAPPGEAPAGARPPRPAPGPGGPGVHRPGEAAQGADGRPGRGLPGPLPRVG